MKKKQYKIGFLGYNRSANAILNGIIESDLLRPRKVIVYDDNSDKLDMVTYNFDVDATRESKYAAEESEYLVLNVKPKELDALAEELIRVRPAKIISVMPGLSKEKIKKLFGIDAKVARVAMNYPCVDRNGVVAIDMSDFNDNLDDIQFISNVFATMGYVLSTSDDKMNVMDALCGGASVFPLMLIDAMIDAAAAQGLSRFEAEAISVHTVFGTMRMLSDNDISIEEAIKGACSEDSMALTAVNNLENSGLRASIDSVVQACVNKIKGNLV